MKNCGPRNVKKHRKIKNGDHYVVLDVSLNFVNLDKTKITSSKPEEY